MQTCLVGYTGFVGQNLALSHPYDGLFNSQNITDAFGACPDLLVYAGVTGTKYLANHEPEKDLEAKRTALDNIRRINPKRLVLISSVDVYRDPVNVDEAVVSPTEHMQPYGYTRFLLEQWVREAYPDALLIRLPGIYGTGLKKNFVYDLIHLVPPMLTNAKHLELVRRDGFIRPYYLDQGNGYWKLNCECKAEYAMLRDYFERSSFNALHFTDSRGVYQYYPLNRLQRHMEIALNADLRVVNIATEPFSIREMVDYVNGEPFNNWLDQPVVHYDVRTRHNSVFGGWGGYILRRAEVLDDLAQYIAKERKKLQVGEPQSAAAVAAGA